MHRGYMPAPMLRTKADHSKHSSTSKTNTNNNPESRKEKKVTFFGKMTTYFVPSMTVDPLPQQQQQQPQQHLLQIPSFQRSQPHASTSTLTTTIVPVPAPSTDTNTDDDSHHPEIESWCSVCDRQIVLPRSSKITSSTSLQQGGEDDDSMGEGSGSGVGIGRYGNGNGNGNAKMKIKRKVDCEGREVVIVPVPARLPKKVLKGGKPGLKRTQTAQRLAQLAEAANAIQSQQQQHQQQRPTPIEPSRLSPTSPLTENPSSPSSSSPQLPQYNQNLYCSAVCSDVDGRRSSKQAEELEVELKGLWAGEFGYENEMVSPGWVGTPDGTKSATPGEETQKPSPTSINSKAAVSEPFNEDFGYFDMARYGVQHGLMERERRRSLHAQSNGMNSTPVLPIINNSASNSIAMQRGGSTQSGYSQGAISSSDSLSSMWSSSDGRTFSEDSSEYRWSSNYGSSINNSNNNATNNSGRGNGGFRGMTPMVSYNNNKPNRSDSTSSERPAQLGSAMQRPVLAGHRSLSHGIPRMTSSKQQSGMMASHGSTINLNGNGSEPGSAPTSSSLLHSYAMAFHRTPSSADLQRVGVPSPVLPPTIEDETIDPLAAIHNTKSRRRDSSTETSLGQRRNSRAAFSPVSYASLGSSFTADAMARNRSSDEASTPTQSLVGPASAIRSRVARERQSSIGSRRSSEEDSAAVIAEEGQGMATIRKPRTKQGSQVFTQNFWKDSPTMAITIGDEIISRQNSPLATPPPAFGRSFTGQPMDRSQRRPSSSYYSSSLRSDTSSTHLVNKLSHTSLRNTTGQRASAVPSLGDEPTRAWSWDSVQKAGGKMYALPTNAVAEGELEGEKSKQVGGTAGRLFYFHH